MMDIQMLNEREKEHLILYSHVLLNNHLSNS